MMISTFDAYKAMTKFLENYWERNGRPDELGGLLGSLAVLEDGRPADPVMWADWLDAVERVGT